MINRTFTPLAILKTERLTLRQLLLTDEQEIFTLRSDSEINKYLGRQPAKTIDDARNFITMINENLDKNISLYWAITLTHQNIFVGTICLFNFSEDNNNCEIGYELLRNYQRQGIMKEAAEKVIDYAFTSIQVDKIVACPHRDNQASLKLMEKLFFRKSDQPDETNPELICFYLTNSGSEHK